MKLLLIYLFVFIINIIDNITYIIIMKLKTIYDLDVKWEDYEYNFQTELTRKLDSVEWDFSQDIINEILLWKVNRYSLLSESTLKKLNLIDKKSLVLDVDLTIELLNDLLNTKWIRIAMASTILRFKNPNIYQIIDQRVYRFIYWDIWYRTIWLKNEEIIEMYIKYLKDLKDICEKNKIDFSESDRILYALDKKLNRGFGIRY